MPKLFVHALTGTFTADARVRVAAALTDLGIACERLAQTKKVRDGVFVFFSEYAPDAVFSGGEIASKPLIALIVYALEGGLDAIAKKKLIAGATSILEDNAAAGNGPLPVYVGIQETPEADWGMYGRQVTLAELREGG